VQLTRPLRNAVLALGACTIGAGAAHATPPDDAAVSTLLRIFNDSQHIAVRSMMGDYRLDLPNDLALGFHLNNERVTIPAIQAPPGSAEAVDAITTASRPIAGNAFHDFVKVRNELQSGLSRPHAGLEYYYSTESDYLGQQLAAHADRDFMDRQLNLSVGTSYGWDAITPLADDDTQTGNARKQTLHWNAVATEALTPATLVRVGVEYNIVRGLQHNPYRNVYAGGTNVPERHPEERQRRDAFVRVNQALPNRASVKLSYRLYNDDWGVTSHEVGTRLSQYITRGLSARWEYRWYTQTAADFWRSTYSDVDGVGGFLTGDYRLGPLSSHLFGAALRADLEAFAPTRTFVRRMTLWLDLERYFNSNNYSANVVETGVDFRFP